MLSLMEIEEQITEFNNKYAQYTGHTLSDEDYNSEWTSNFLQIPGTNLFALMIGALEGSHTLLRHTVARKIAEIIEKESPENLRELFGLQDDLTDEEKARVLKE